MTVQASEILVYNGSRMAMQALPLEVYFEKVGHRPRFGFMATNNWRGYIGKWEIVGGKLFLAELLAMGMDETPGGIRMALVQNRISVTDIFPESGGRVFADWYTGELRCPQGEVVEFYRGKFGALYERYLVIDVKDGVVTGEKIVSGNQENKAPAKRQAAEGAPERAKRMEGFRQWLTRLR